MSHSCGVGEYVRERIVWRTVKILGSLHLDRERGNGEWPNGDGDGDGCSGFECPIPPKQRR